MVRVFPSLLTFEVSPDFARAADSLLTALHAALAFINLPG